MAACAHRGPDGLELTDHTYLRLSRELVFVPPQEIAQLVPVRPAMPLLGAVLTTDDTPRMLVLYDGGLDERGMRKVEFVGWDDAPEARTLVQELLLARARN